MDHLVSVTTIANAIAKKYHSNVIANRRKASDSKIAILQQQHDMLCHMCYDTFKSKFAMKSASKLKYMSN